MLKSSFTLNSTITKTKFDHESFRYWWLQSLQGISQWKAHSHVHLTLKRTTGILEELPKLKFKNLHGKGIMTLTQIANSRWASTLNKALGKLKASTLNIHTNSLQQNSLIQIVIETQNYIEASFRDDKNGVKKLSAENGPSKLASSFNVKKTHRKHLSSPLQTPEKAWKQHKIERIIGLSRVLLSWRNIAELWWHKITQKVIKNFGTTLDSDPGLYSDLPMNAHSNVDSFKNHKKTHTKHISTPDKQQK